jgi:hypothetical protein
MPKLIILLSMRNAFEPYIRLTRASIIGEIIEKCVKSLLISVIKEIIIDLQPTIKRANKKLKDS